MTTVSVIQRRLTHYRVPLFNALREQLKERKIHLRLLHGEGTHLERRKNDEGKLEWAEPLQTNYVPRTRLCWQPFFSKVQGDDLLILTHENSMIANHIALLSRPSKRIAFWGHGANFQATETGFARRLKSWGARNADWYFAYTEASVAKVRGNGFPEQRITCVNNSIDTKKLASDLAELSYNELNHFKKKFRIQDGPIALFLGSLYKHKKLSFLISCAQKIRSEVPSFQLLVVGDGPDRPVIEKAARAYDWIHFIGPQTGKMKAASLKVADIIMNPGLVGLGILDSFVSRKPMITTDCGLHSPEIAYLTPSNGIKTKENETEYVAACIELLLNGRRRENFIQECKKSAEQYSLEAMAHNFATGIFAALKI